MSNPPLKPLHSDQSLIQTKLEKFKKFTTPDLVASLKPDQPGALKCRPDGTILDGHHRVKILRDRGVDVDRCPEKSSRKTRHGNHEI